MEPYSRTLWPYSTLERKPNAAWNPSIEPYGPLVLLKGTPMHLEGNPNAAWNPSIEPYGPIGLLKGTLMQHGTLVSNPMAL